MPVVVPTHFVYDGADEIIFHLARANPVWDALQENSKALMSVAGAYQYIPTGVNSGGHDPENYGVPTSYYAAVQAIGSCEVIDDDSIADILNKQLRHFQPEGGHAEVIPGDNSYARQFVAIRGIVMTLEEIRAKFKFGGNKTVEHRLSIAEWLAARETELASEARSHLLRRMST